VCARYAARLVRAAKYVAAYVTTSPHGAADLMDASKRQILRFLARHETAWVCEVFGTIIIGRPEPYQPSPSEAGIAHPACWFRRVPP
jgi:hypothetical protein